MQAQVRERSMEDIIKGMAERFTPAEESQPSPIPLTQLLKKSEPEKSEVVPYTADDKEQLNHALGACLAVQRTYGKQAGDFEKVVQVFIKLMQGHEPMKVIAAIREWVMKSPEFPTPADILGILSPQPKFDYAMYSSFNEKLKRGEQLGYMQLEYINAYEKNAMRGL